MVLDYQLELGLLKKKKKESAQGGAGLLHPLLPTAPSSIWALTLPCPPTSTKSPKPSQRWTLLPKDQPWEKSRGRKREAGEASRAWGPLSLPSVPNSA